MVDRMVDAARDLLVAEGYEHFTTNRVATRAGVSPGSLYQYFPDKAALIDEVTQRYVAATSEAVVAALVDHVHEDVESMGRATAEALLTALERDAGLLRVVWEDLPASRLRDDRLGLEQRVRDVLRVYLTGRAGTDGRPAEASRAAWVIVLTVEYLAVRWVLDDDAPATREELLDDLVRLGLGALAPLNRA